MVAFALVGNAEQRQDRAVQRADRQPAEGRELSRRHGRAQGRRARHAGGPRRRDRRPARHLFAARPQPRRGDHPRRGARPPRQAKARPTCCVCVADATNLRLALRLVLELKRVGRPMMLVLNMIDIARRRGIEIDARDAVGASSACRSCTSVAVRRGGTDELLRRDRRAARRAAGGEPPQAPGSAPDAGRVARQRSARPTASSRAAVSQPARPDTLARRGSTRCCCTRWPASLILLVPAVRDVPGGVRLGASR